METKISGSGWFCVRVNDGRWVPVFKLSARQLELLREAGDELKDLWQISND